MLKKWNLQRRRIDCSVLPRGAPQACMGAQWGWHQSWIVFIPYHKPSTPLHEFSQRSISNRSTPVQQPHRRNAADTARASGEHVSPQQ